MAFELRTNCSNSLLSCPVKYALQQQQQFPSFVVDEVIFFMVQNQRAEMIALKCLNYGRNHEAREGVESGPCHHGYRTIYALILS